MDEARLLDTEDEFVERADDEAALSRELESDELIALLELTLLWALELSEEVIEDAL